MSLSTSSVQVKQSPAENTVPPGVGRVSTRRSHSAAAVRKRALAGCVGAAELEALVAVCAEAGVDAARIRARSVTTGHAIIQVDANGQNCIIVEPGANGTVGTDDIAAFLDGYGTGDVLLTQNEISHMPDVLRAAHEKGLTVALNPSPFSAEILSWPLECVDIFIVNEIEGGALSGESVPEKVLDALRRRFPGAATVLTLGHDGAMYADQTESFSVPAHRVTVVDTTAAGDTFTGYFLAMLLRGGTPKDSMEIASKSCRRLP